MFYPELQSKRFCFSFPMFQPKDYVILEYLMLLVYYHEKEERKRQSGKLSFICDIIGITAVDIKYNDLPI